MKVVTTLNRDLFYEYGQDTLSTWVDKFNVAPVLVVEKKDVEFFKNIFSDRFDVIGFSENSLLKITEIKSREAELRNNRGYSDNYRWAAGRFSWKVFALHDAIQEFGDECFIWLDADTLALEKCSVMLDLLASVTSGAGFFGRAHKNLHAETGLVVLNGESGRQAFMRVYEVYNRVDIFRFNEWTDSYVYSWAFSSFADCTDFSVKFNLKSSNPIFEFDRGKSVLHLKGNRKGSVNRIVDHFRVLIRR